MTKKPEARGIQSIEVGYRILLALQRGPTPMSLKRISELSGLSSSATHNYITSFIRIGFVEAELRGTYKLGPSISSMGLTAMREIDMFEVVRKEAVALSDSTERGVALLVWEANQGPVIIFHRQGQRRGAFDLRNGSVSILRTGGGNVFIAHLDRAITESQIIADGKAEGLDARASLQAADIIRDRVRVDGYALSELRELPGYTAISAPVWDASDNTIYALTLTGPTHLMDTGPRSSQVLALLETTRRLSRYLGAPAPRWADEDVTSGED